MMNNQERVTNTIAPEDIEKEKQALLDELCESGMFGELKELKGRKLNYLEGGLETWFENVNNFWYHRNYWKGKHPFDHNYHADHKDLSTSYGESIQLSQDTKLDQKVAGLIDLAMEMSLHDEVKDLYGLFHYEQRLRPESLLEIDEVRKIVRPSRDAVKEHLWKQGAWENFAQGNSDQNGSWLDENIPTLVPKDKSVRETHPLILPFLPVIESLGDTHGIPPYLLAEAKLAGRSASVQNLAGNLVEWGKVAYQTLLDNGAEDSAKGFPTSMLLSYRCLDILLHRKDFSPEEAKLVAKFARNSKFQEGQDYNEWEKKRKQISMEWARLFLTTH